MMFGIILDADVPRTRSIACARPPPRVLRKLKLTEGDELYDYDHLGGVWTKGKHRKWAGCLSAPLFYELVEHLSLVPRPDENIGALGMPSPDMPNGGVGLQGDCISFSNDRSDNEDAFIEAHVTPYTRYGIRPARAPRAWTDIKDAILHKWGHYGAQKAVRARNPFFLNGFGRKET
jgi:hypothetical protein